MLGEDHGHGGGMRQTDADRWDDRLRLHPKVAAGSLGSLVSTILLWGLSELGVNPPPDVAAAITGLIVLVSGYIAPRLAGEGNLPAGPESEPAIPLHGDGSDPSGETTAGSRPRRG